MKSQNTKSTNELKSEVHRDLKKVNQDIDEIQNKLTPGQLIDDAIFSRRGSNPRDVFEHLKSNPIGSTFLTLGTLMLMEDESHQSYEKVARSKFSSGINSTRDTIKNKMPHREPGTPSTADKLKSRVVDMKDSFDSKVDEIKQGLATKVPDVKDEALNETPGLEETKSRVSSGIESSKQKLSSFQSDVSSKFSAGKEKIKGLDSTTLMAMGAGLGAITGAALPLSETEGRFVEEKFGSQFSEINQDFREALNECSNVLKDLVIHDAKDFTVNIF